MQFNPWAMVVFLIGGVYMFGSGLSETPVATAFFLGLAPAWIACGYVWDMLTIKKDKDWVCPIERSNWYPID